MRTGTTEKMGKAVAVAVAAARATVGATTTAGMVVLMVRGLG